MRKISFGLNLASSLDPISLKLDITVGTMKKYSFWTK